MVFPGFGSEDKMLEIRYLSQDPRPFILTWTGKCKKKSWKIRVAKKFIQKSFEKCPNAPECFTGIRVHRILDYFAILNAGHVTKFGCNQKLQHHFFIYKKSQYSILVVKPRSWSYIQSEYQFYVLHSDRLIFNIGLFTTPVFRTLIFSCKDGFICTPSFNRLSFFLDCMRRFLLEYFCRISDK